METTLFDETNFINFEMYSKNKNIYFTFTFYLFNYFDSKNICKKFLRNNDKKNSFFV